MKYINLGRSPKQYFGVTLNPMEVVDVPGIINDKTIVPVRCKLQEEKASLKPKSVSKKISTQPDTIKEKESVTENG